MKTAFLITARLKSTRLPKKILLEVAGKPLIVHMLDRLNQSKTIDKIIICTSINPQDDPLEEIAVQENVHCFRGSEDDVLLRLYDAAKAHHLSFFANVTADCPLVDPLLVDCAVMEFNKTNSDLTMYDNREGDLPFDCYVIRTSALEKIIQKKIETDTEVWLKHFLSDNNVKINAIKAEEKYRHGFLKTSIDYPEDYDFMKTVFGELHESGGIFSLLDVITLVKKKPAILEINSTKEQLERWKDHRHSVGGGLYLYKSK